MPESVDELTRELSVLRDGPALVMPGAAAARRRGEQRSRRRRGGLAAAALVLLAGTSPLAATLTGPGAARPTGPAAPAPSLEDGLLGPQDLARVQPGTWQLAPAGSALAVLPATCDTTAPTVGPDAEVRALTGPRRAYVRQHLVRYATEQQAAAAFRALRGTLAGCADGPRTTRLLPALQGTSETRFYAERVGATGSFPFAVERSGAVLSAVLIGAERVAGPVSDVEALPPLADAAARALIRTQGAAAAD